MSLPGNPPVKNSGTALCACAFTLIEGKMQIMREARDNNANFAWEQHFIHHLAPQGMAGFVLANGSMSSKQSGEGDIRRALIETDLGDCMIALPGQLFFYSTQLIEALAA